MQYFGFICFGLFGLLLFLSTQLIVCTQNTHTIIYYSIDKMLNVVRN